MCGSKSVATHLNVKYYIRASEGCRRPAREKFNRRRAWHGYIFFRLLCIFFAWRLFFSAWSIDGKYQRFLWRKSSIYNQHVWHVEQAVTGTFFFWVNFFASTTVELCEWFTFSRDSNERIKYKEPFRVEGVARREKRGRRNEAKWRKRARLKCRKAHGNKQHKSCS